MKWWKWMQLLAPFALAVLAGIYLQQHVDPVHIWGGTQCNAPGPNGIEACFGYPPTGIIVLTLISFVVLAGLTEVGDRIRENYQ
jgi:hypothetical protein